MIEKYILENIYWEQLLSQNWEAIDKTFEFLCADFMKIKYKLDRAPLPSQNDNFPWIEWEPIIKDWFYYWYQSKFWDDAFDNNKGFDKSFITTQNSLNTNIYKLSYLCLFSKKDYPTSNRDLRDQKFKNFENNNKLEIHRYFWNEFLSEIKKEDYYELLYKYFPIENIKKEIHKKCENKDDICEIKLNNDVNNVKNWFEWDYLSDIKKAELYQKNYSYKKLSYSSFPFILDKFDEVEKSIADEIFEELELWVYTSLDDYIDRCKNHLDDTSSKNKYKTELESIMNYKKWIFVNYWTQWLSCLNYIQQDKIEFKDKRNG